MYISWSAQHFVSFIYSARSSAIWRRQVEALSREVHLIADTMAYLSVLELRQTLLPFRSEGHSMFLTINCTITTPGRRQDSSRSVRAVQQPISEVL